MAVTRLPLANALPTIAFAFLMTDTRPQSERVDLSPLALRVLSLLLGVFFLGMGLNKIDWIADSNLLADRFVQWLPTAASYARWYLETIAIPGAPLFARLVPLGELSAAAALTFGFRINVVAAVAFVMVLNFHFATSAFSSWAFLRDGTGPPVLGALLALAMAGRHLPFCVRWPAAPRAFAYRPRKAVS